MRLRTVRVMTPVLAALGPQPTKKHATRRLFRTTNGLLVLRGELPYANGEFNSTQFNLILSLAAAT